MEKIINNEIHLILQNYTWYLTDLPPVNKTIKC
jgi:hypothetical protein